MDPTTRHQLARRVKATLIANDRVLRRTAHRGEELRRLAKQSEVIVERAVRTLRAGR